MYKVYGIPIVFLSIIGAECIILSGIKLGDIMNKDYGPLSGYQWSHFLLYALVGYVKMMTPEQALSISVIWELVEYIFGHLTNTIGYWSSGGPEGQFKDVALNMAGYATGTLARKLKPCTLKNCEDSLTNAYLILSTSLVVISVLSEIKNNYPQD